MLWNKLSEEIQNAPSISSFKQLLNANLDTNKLYFYGERWPSIHHARIRMGCSKLNSDLCRNLHVISEPTCRCGHHTEDAKHFLLHCPLYDMDRAIMMTSVNRITDVTTVNLLYGNGALCLEENEKVFKAVHEFIISTKRFI